MSAPDDSPDDANAAGATETAGATGATGRERMSRLRGRLALSRRLRLTSLRVRLIAVFVLVALTAAVSVSGIAYWLNRDALLKRTQHSVVEDFRKTLGRSAGLLPKHPDCSRLTDVAQQMHSATSQGYEVVLHTSGPTRHTCEASSQPHDLTMTDVPDRLREAVRRKRGTEHGNKWKFHLYWQRIDHHDEPYLVVGSKVRPYGPTGYAFKSLRPESRDLNSLAWSLGIATALALVGAALLAQAASSTVLRPVRRVGEAARLLGEGQLDTRLEVRGADELADLSRTFNAAAHSLQHRVQELSDREETSIRFVADMSHELRTPLTAITAVTELLEEETESFDPMIRPAIQLVVTESRRLNDLVENLMEVTRFDAGSATLVLDDVDVADQVTACIDTRAWLDAVRLNAPRGIEARLDPRRLDVVLANLIGNALKHGGSPVQVTVRQDVARRPRTGEPGPRLERVGGVTEVSTHTGTFSVGDTLLVIEVRDSGPGIPTDVLSHVFDRFYKANTARPRSEGSGLGLSIALENARMHGGELAAANDPTSGAVFTLRLPLRPDDEGDEGDEGDERDPNQQGAPEGDAPAEPAEGASEQPEQVEEAAEAAEQRRQRPDGGEESDA